MLPRLPTIDLMKEMPINKHITTYTVECRFPKFHVAFRRGLHIPRSNACNVHGHKKVWGWAGRERNDLTLKKKVSSFQASATM